MCLKEVYAWQGHLVQCSILYVILTFRNNYFYGLYVLIAYYLPEQTFVAFFFTLFKI